MLIKSQLGEDKRRFRLKEASFPCLCFTISSLYCLSSDSIYTISYLDDENEYVTLASTEDLKEAHSISPTMIKILIIKCDINRNSNNNINNNSNISDINNCNNVNSNNTNNNSNNNNSQNRKAGNIEDIALSMLSNDKIVSSINSLLSNTLTDYLPSIINTTIPYTIPILVSTISNMKKNGDSDPLCLDVPISSREKRFSCSAEEKFLEPLRSSQTLLNGSGVITSLNGLNNNFNNIINNNSHSSILSHSLPVYSQTPTSSIQPAAEVTVSSNQTNSSPLKDSTQDLILPPPPSATPSATSYRKSSSPIPFLFGSRNDNQVVPESSFRPISPVTTELINQTATENSSPNRKRTTSLKTFFTSILSSSSSISNNNNNNNNNISSNSNTINTNTISNGTIAEEPSTPKQQTQSSDNPFINQPTLEQIVS
ncbi:hypothetical protein PPL_05544 [Heterostelium album PN500]|uniref:PB1 domain-containing protein n=1 Tax=Heterostelium pallidum (strain ATCC 26659 / Pp 5 / PN500) TaxID=670386 RepID=D3BAG8_HETP5|nr:hypothetical protein PPL_05544 [Heterostelium album PN500]EFA81555.1 hypothetical protein PPL_05544 [Heterostelium album PN500]|eukprot:XP_020433672.1 hypothetical protein PPL_05544 [Heterostelium album PN500]